VALGGTCLRRPGSRGRDEFDGDDVSSVVGGLLRVEQDVLATGAVKFFDILDREIQRRGQVGEYAIQRHFSRVQIERECTGNLIDRRGASAGVNEVCDSIGAPVSPAG
jgi:hypothetical protein